MAVLAGHSSGVQHQLQVLLRAISRRERVTQAALQALPMLKLACFVHCHLLQVLFSVTRPQVHALMHPHA